MSDVDPPRLGGGTVETGRATSPNADVPPPPILRVNGLDLPEEFTFDDWVDIAGQVASAQKNRQWWAGDLVLAGERFGERATQFWNDLGYRWESLSNCVRVCRRFPREQRAFNLTFSHFAVVYALADVEAAYRLGEAEECGWTVAQLRAEVFGVKQKVKRFSVEELRERLAAWQGIRSLRNNGRKTCAAFLESLI